MKVLVTGLGGFLGGAIGERLLQQGHSLRTLSRRPLPAWEQRGAELVLGPLESREAVIEACRGVDLVYHVAAKAGIWGSYLDYYRSNVEGTRNVVEACLACGVPRLVYTSSPSVVFDGKDHQQVDESQPYARSHLNHYSETKALAEQLVLAAHGRGGLATVSLRPHLIWGPGDPHILPRVLQRADAGRLMRIGDGRNLVDMTYVDNAAEAHLRAAESLGLQAPQAGKAYFITNGTPVRLWEWIDEILQSLGRKPIRRRIGLAQARWIGGALEWLYRTWRLPGEPPMTRFAACQLGTSHTYDISAARRDFGYEPSVDYAEGMRRLVDHFRR
jgi:nucleoside-diphosphate-sugar epimerase